MSWKFQPNDPRSKSLDAATSGNGKAFALNDYDKANWLVVFSAGVTAGAVAIESAHDPNYTGTWHELTPPVSFAANTAKGGVADFPPGGWVRARVTAAITGGTVMVYINGLKVGV